MGDGVARVPGAFAGKRSRGERRPRQPSGCHRPVDARLARCRVPDQDEEQVPPSVSYLTDMSYIPTLIASLDARLDELAIEISTLQDGRAALRTPTPATPPTAIAHNGAARKRPRRLTPQTKTPAAERTAPAADPEAEPPLRRRTVRAPRLPTLVGEPPRKRPRPSGRARR